MLLVDTKEKVFMRDDVLKAGIADLRPVSQWLSEEVMYIWHSTVCVYLQKHLVICTVDVIVQFNIWSH